MKRIYAQRKQVVRPSVPETKYFDTSVSDTVVATASDWSGTEVPCDQRINANGTTITAYTDSALIPSACGTGYGEIIGSRYQLKKMRVKGFIKPAALQDQANAPQAAVTRIILVQDVNPNGSQAQGETIFTDFGSDAQNVHSYLNMGSTAGKFRILKDVRLVSQPAVAATDGASTNSNSGTGDLFSFTWTPKKPIQVTLKGPNSATPQISQLQNCNIFLLALTENGASVLLSFCARAYFCE